MPNTATIYLPLNTYVSVACFTNAAFLQQVTITPETGNAVVLTGSGEHNAPMPNGNFSLTTPSSSQDPKLGYRMVVSSSPSSRANRGRRRRSPRVAATWCTTGWRW